MRTSKHIVLFLNGQTLFMLPMISLVKFNLFMVQLLTCIWIMHADVNTLKEFLTEEIELFPLLGKSKQILASAH